MQNSSSEVVYRRWCAGDAQQKLAVFFSAVREVACRDYSPEQIRVWSAIEPVTFTHHCQQASGWVAMVASRMAGFITLDSRWHLDKLFVSADFQRQSIASGLLVLAEQHARAQHAEAITADVSITAQPFFSAKGFEQTAAQYVERGGITLMNHRMEKTLR
ncbi:MAG: putative N-acetyltransferase YafP [Candidatus Erwinia impunctatus]|nr:putative N-acetyltransferase YafP [Culicoides impunctatus]